VYLVTYDSEAVEDFEAVKGKKERKAVFNVVDKLRRLGPKLVPPHMAGLKGEPNLFELRPLQGKTHVRPLYRRFGDDYVILAMSVKPDKADFPQAVERAKARSERYKA
jgi:hypothetical protein